MRSGVFFVVRMAIFTSSLAESLSDNGHWISVCADEQFRSDSQLEP